MQTSTRTTRPATEIPSRRSLTRFLLAQENNWRHISRDLATGQKQAHWMWFVFPQLQGLARSETARYFGLRDKSEAERYLNNEILRRRLLGCIDQVMQHDRNIFDSTDRKKLKSCMTLFRELAADPTPFDAVLAKFYDGELCPLTLDLLAGRPIPERQPKPWAPQQRTAMGRVEVGGNHAARRSARTQAAIAAARSAAQRYRDDAEPMSHREIQAYLLGLGLSVGVTQKITDRWVEDQNRASQQGWEARDAEH
jgi:uncharacterized protein (DUF1810 family)